MRFGSSGPVRKPAGPTLALPALERTQMGPDEVETRCGPSNLQGAVLHSRICQGVKEHSRHAPNRNSEKRPHRSQPISHRRSPCVSGAQHEPRICLGRATSTTWVSYVGISGLGALMDLSSTLGDPGSAPIRGISSVRDSGGFRISAGTHVTPWAALQIDFQYVAPVKFESTSNGTQRIPIYTGSLTLKGYPLAKLLESTLEGRLQPFVKVSPSVSGLAHTPIKTPIAFTIGVGGGHRVLAE